MSTHNTKKDQTFQEEAKCQNQNDYLSQMGLDIIEEINRVKKEFTWQTKSFACTGDKEYDNYAIDHANRYGFFPPKRNELPEPILEPNDFDGNPVEEKSEEEDLNGNALKLDAERMTGNTQIGKESFYHKAVREAREDFMNTDSGSMEGWPRVRQCFPRTNSADELRSHPELTHDEINQALHGKECNTQVPDHASPEALGKTGVKYDDEKIAYHLIPPFALAGTALQFKYGGAKYDSWNHSKGMPWSKQYRAALGHILDIGMGNLEDPETGAGHVYAAICSLMMLAENMVMYPENNDLYPSAYKKHAEALKLHMELTKRNILEAIKKLNDSKK